MENPNDDPCAKRNEFIEEVIERHGDALLNWATGFVTSYKMKSQQLDDIQQEFYTKLSENYQKIIKTEIRNERSYFLGIMKNLCYDQLKKYVKSSNTEPPQDVFSVESHEDQTLEAIAFEQRLKLIQKRLSLEDKKVEVFKMYLQGFKHKEIAKELTMNTNTVSSIISRIINALKNLSNKKDLE